MEHRHPLTYSAWILDLDGTLYYPLPVRITLGVELAARAPHLIPLIRRFRSEHERVRFAAPERNRSPFERQLLGTALGLGTEPAAVEAAVMEWMFQRPGPWIRRFRRRGLLGAVARFRQHGGRVGIASDYPARAKLRALGWEDWDAIVANGEPGGALRMKPDPEPFLLAARLLQTGARECLVIGDRPELDRAGARAAGMDFCSPSDRVWRAARGWRG
jgi:FMN phosphatase YigB (HAD superfamily)